MSDLQSFHMDVSQNMTSAGQPLLMDMAIDLIEPDRYYAKVSTAGMQLELLGRGTDAYVRLPGQDWRSYEEAVGLSLEDLGISAEAFSKQAYSQLNFAQAADEVVFEGTTHAGGITLDRIRATISGDKLGPVLKEQLGGSGLITQALSSLNGSIVYELQIGHDDALLRQLDATMDVTISGVSVRGTSTLAISSFNDVAELPPIPPP